jgi:FkbM family methyltransferase
MVPVTIFEQPGCDAFVDVGAHFGVYSIAMAALNDAPTHIFEPNERNQVKIQRNLNANSLDATIHGEVVTDHDGTVTFYESFEIPKNANPNYGDTIGHSTASEFANSESHRAIEKNAISLATFLNEQGYSDPFLKIDPEGEELNIIQDLFDNTSLDTVRGLVELHPDKIDEGSAFDVLRRLDQEGAEVELIKDNIPHRPAFWFSTAADN